MVTHSWCTQCGRQDHGGDVLQVGRRSSGIVQSIQAKFRVNLKQTATQIIPSMSYGENVPYNILKVLRNPLGKAWKMSRMSPNYCHIIKLFLWHRNTIKKGCGLGCPGHASVVFHLLWNKGLVTLQGPLPQSLQNMVRRDQPWSALDIKHKQVWPPQASQALDWASLAHTLAAGCAASARRHTLRVSWRMPDNPW